MHIRVNGTDHDVPDASTVADLLREIGLLGDQWRSRWIATSTPCRPRHLRAGPGAVVECVTLVGGG